MPASSTSRICQIASAAAAELHRLGETRPAARAAADLANVVALQDRR